MRYEIARNDCTKAQFYLFTGAIVLLVLIVYYPIINAYFASDDFFHLKIPARDGLSLRSFLRPHGPHFEPAFRPIFALEFKLFGTKPKGYYCVNLLIHICNTILVTALFSKLLMQRKAGIITGLLFGITAAHFSVVRWITTQAQLFAMLWFLIGTLFFLNYLKALRKRALILSLLFNILMVGSFSVGIEVGLIYAMLFLNAHYLTSEKRQALRDAFLIAIPFFITFLSIHFFLRTICLPREGYFSLSTNLGGTWSAFGNLMQAIWFVIAGMWKGYVCSFTGALFLRYDQWLFAVAVLAVTALLVDWSALRLKQNIICLTIWAFLMYFPPVLVRMRLGFAWFTAASRYRYFPCSPAAAIAALLCCNLKPFLSTGWLRHLRIIVIAFGILIVWSNVREIRKDVMHFCRQTRAFHAIAKNYVRGVRKRVAIQASTPFQIIDEPFGDAKSNYAAWNVKPSLLVEIFFTEAESKSIRFISERDIQSRDCSIPLYAVKKGHGHLHLVSK